MTGRWPSAAQRTRLRLFGLLLVLGGAAACGVPQPLEAAAPQGARAMSDVQVSLVLPQTKWTMGLPFHATVRLANGGGQAVEVPTSLSPSEFEFRVTSVERAEARVLSGKLRRLSRRPDPAPVPRFVMPLAPSATAEYTENLGDYANPPLAAGRYQVNVRWTRGQPGADTSASTEVEVVVPRPQSLAPLGDAGTGTLALVWSRPAGEAGWEVLLREGAHARPADGVSAPVGSGSGSPPAQLALSPPIAAGSPARWCAWLDADTLHASIAQRATVLAQAAPVATGLQGASLCAHVWPLSEESAAMLVLGSTATARMGLAMVQATAGEPLQCQPADLPLQAPPLWWAAQRDEAADEFRCVTVVADGAGTLVQAHRVGRDGRCLASTTLARRSEAVQAAALAPVHHGPAAGAGFVDLLFGPGGTPPRMTYQRLPLDGGAPLAELAVPIPRDKLGQAAGDWALAPTDDTTPRLLARLGDQVIGKVLSPTGRGFVVAPDAAGASGLRLQQIGHDWWALWVDPAHGLHFARLPGQA